LEEAKSARDEILALDPAARSTYFSQLKEEKKERKAKEKREADEVMQRLMAKEEAREAREKERKAKAKEEAREAREKERKAKEEARKLKAVAAREAREASKLKAVAALEARHEMEEELRLELLDAITAAGLQSDSMKKWRDDIVTVSKNSGGGGLFSQPTFNKWLDRKPVKKLCTEHINVMKTYIKFQKERAEQRASGDGTETELITKKRKKF
jgi:hypothetical protein